MRIAFVGVRGVPALYGGFETAVEEIGKRLVKRGHDVTVYCRSGYGDKSETTYEGIKKKYVPRLRLKIADTLSHTFVSLMHLFFNPPDVIIVMDPANGPICVIPRFRGTPVAINVDGLEWKRDKWSVLGRKYYYFASWAATKVASAVIADSHCIEEFYKKTWNCDCYYASYGAYVEQSTKLELLKEYGLIKDDYFLVVARLEPENNTDLIIKAFERVKTDKKLIIVGGVSYESAYVRNLKANTKDKRVRFLGGIYNQEHLKEIMCNCFAYIHGHMVGGTNPVLLRSLGCGAYVLYLDTEYHFNAEVVVDCGVPFAKSVIDLESKLQDVIDFPDKMLKYKKRGPKRIKQAYTWDMATDLYEQLCRRLCKRQ